MVNYHNYGNILPGGLSDMHNIIRYDSPGNNDLNSQFVSGINIFDSTASSNEGRILSMLPERVSLINSHPEWIQYDSSLKIINNSKVRCTFARSSNDGYKNSLAYYFYDS